ncbi:acyltransferase [Geminocystis sp. GBBB08]|uniref:acyltransferase family protein n=1 Tax=Geminocystis sp. GBBB08 TaxID=2604140 RepID=UPI0027E2CC1E|nr:acyltransferase [Geminocystis sp. GBBB08]MBL1209499.1 acyltransferase [Geminocystis sp. GBBB08]
MKKQFITIQAFRGLAAILVVTRHATLISQDKFGQDFMGGIFAQGGIGVDFFFVLSGFIMLLIHFKDLGQSKKVTSFAIKRLIRIYPIYWIITILCLPFFFLSISEEKSFNGDWGYIINSFLLIPQEKLPLLSPGWTLTHELYFYILVALLIYFWKSKIVRGILFIIVFGSLYKALFDFSGTWDYKYRTYQTILDSNFLLSFMFSRYNLEFFAGCLSGFLAYKYILAIEESRGDNEKNITKMNKLKFIFSLLSVIFLIIFLISPDSLTLIYKNKILIVLYYSFVVGILLSVSTIMENLTNFKTSYFLKFLGDASYSIYLVHYPALFLFAKILFLIKLENILGSTVTMYLIVLLALAVSIAIYLYIELPVWNWSKKRIISLTK